VNRKKTNFVFIAGCIGILLFGGSPSPYIHTTTAQIGSEDRYGLQVDTNEFNTLIGLVGPSSPLEDPYEPEEDNVYEIVSPDTFTLINFFSNFSGYTFWQLGNHTFEGISRTFELGNSTLIGQYYIIIDGDVRPVNMDEVGVYGFNVGIPRGDHTISLLYVTKTQEGEILWDSDTIVVRIRAEDNFEPYTLKEVDIDLTYQDIHDQSSQILKGDAITLTTTNNDNTPLYGWERNFVFKPEIDASFLNDGEGISPFSIVKDNSSLDLSFDATVNSTGFEELQFYNEWNKSQGVSFIVDAQGPHLLDPANLPEKVSLRYGNNFFGLLTLAPYGIWHASNTNSFPDEFGCNVLVPCKTWQIADHELAIGFSVGSIRSRTISSPNGPVTIDGSFDFTASLKGVDFIFVDSVDVQTTVPQATGPGLYWMMAPVLVSTLIVRRKNR
jgi:hypothetical protein